MSEKSEKTDWRGPFFVIAFPILIFANKWVDKHNRAKFDQDWAARHAKTEQAKENMAVEKRTDTAHYASDVQVAVIVPKPAP